MSFALPHLLWLLGLPAALLAWEFVRRGAAAATDHPKILRAEAGLHTITLSGGSPRRQPGDRRRFLLCAGLALGVVALARPQWGRLDEPVFDQSRDIIIALDLSRSMLTQDVKPSRLERSKLLIQSLLDHLKGERVGLIVFSGTAFLQAPVSADYEILRDFLPALGPDYLPEGGTNYRQLLDTATEEFGTDSAADRYLIILSDGEATDDDWRDRVPELEKKGVRVIGLGVGTSAGGMIPDGSGSFMKDENGAVVLSKLEGRTLRELAEATHGVYRDASEWVDLAQVVNQTVDEGRKGKFIEHNNVRYAERFQWALAQALACLAASFWLEFPVRPKSRELRLSNAPRAKAKVAAVAAALALLLLAMPARADAPEEAPDPAASLAKIVGRLSQADSPNPLDWSELARETIAWAGHLKSAGQEVPERPVRDALDAVSLGEKADPKVTDWKQLRSELEDLLKKDDPKKQDKQQDQQNKDQKDQDKKDEKNSPQKGDSNQQQGKPESKDQQQDKQQQDKQGGQPQDEKNGRQTPEEQKPGSRQDAFGNMDKGPSPVPTPRPAQQAMQRVGGEKKEDAPDPARNDPSLAVPLEKLQQVKTGDSPAELFEMLRKGEPIPTPANTGKNW
jgi:Ca-activated chloride channel family protein